LNPSLNLSEIIKANKNLVSKNVILAPFLPLRVFEQYAKFEKAFSEKSFCAGFGANLTVIRSGIGVKNVFAALEALKDSRCSNIIFIGSCGGIGGVEIGDIIVADRTGFSGDHGVSARFEKWLNDKCAAFKISRIYSVESVKDETESLIDNLEKGGFLGVDMETSVFQRVSAAHGFDSCAALYVTDKPIKRPFTERFTKEEREKIVSARDTIVRNTIGFFIE
jgi:purine-nucleoside phosphorylase